MTELPGYLAIIGMINGMIGGVILVLPLLSHESGWASTLLVLPISGAFSYYSCYLCVKHLGKQSDLDYALLHHFNGNKFVKIFYDLIVFVNLLFLLVEYFELIVQQWEGLIHASIWNPIANSIVLFCLVFILKYFEFGASILAYGIISIVGYCIFLIWLLASAPPGNNKMPAFGSGTIDLASSMGQAFAIQTFFIPVLKKNPNVDKYMFYTATAYAIGIVAYMYIAYAGAFGILNRTAVIVPPQTVEDFFQHGYWEVMCLESIYLIHLYSVYPEFLLISKKRVFSAFGLKGTAKGKPPIPQIIYTVIFIGICLAMSIIGVNIDTIIQINGAVIGFFFIYFLPLLMHVKCLYFTHKQIIFYEADSVVPSRRTDTAIQIGRVTEKVNPVSSNNLEQNLLNQTRQSRQEQINEQKQRMESEGKLDITNTDQTSDCGKHVVCPAHKGSFSLQVVDWVMLVGMMLIGLFIMADGIYSIFAPPKPV